MAPRSRLLLLARSYAHASSSQARHLHPGVPVPGRQKVGANFKGGSNHETIRFRSSIEKKLDEQDLKLVELGGDIDVFDSKIAGEVEMYKLKEQKDAMNLKSAMDDVKFSFIKGAGAFVGLTAAVGSIVANMPKIIEWLG